MDILLWLNIVVLLQFFILLNIGWRVRNMESYMPFIDETNEIVCRFSELFNTMANVISVEDFENMVNQQAEVNSNESKFEDWDNIQDRRDD